MINVLALGTALVLGFVHALELDHMVAVTVYVTRRPSLLTATGFGVRWGLGHSAAVLLLGAVVLAMGLRISPGIEKALEGLVGAALVGVGVWSLRTARNLHLHAPAEHGDHAHLHLHPGAGPGHDHAHGRRQSHPAHHHPRGIGAVGLVHGLAGTSAAIALVQVSLAPGFWAGLLYLAAFGVGVTSGMATFAALAALAMRKAAGRSITVGRRVSRVAGWLSAGVGIVWLIGAIGS